MERTCTKCGESKPITSFFIRDKTSGRVHAQCKDCYKSHRKSYYSGHYKKYRSDYLERAKTRRERLRQEFRSNMLDFLYGKACIDCGEDDIRVFELDHIDPNKKSFTVSQAVKLGYKWVDVESELKKCQILCANCHKRRTAEQFNWYKA